MYDSVLVFGEPEIVDPSDIIVYEGSEYYSFEDLCNDYGISLSTFLYRVKKGLSIKECLDPNDRRGKTGKEVEFNGKIYNSLKEVCKAYGCSYAVVKTRLLKGVQLKEALGVFDGVVKVEGKLYPSIAYAREIYGISESAFLKRYNKGGTLEEALKIGGDSIVILDGLAYTSLREACAEHNVQYNTVYNRIQRGWSINEAFEVDKWKTFESPEIRKLYFTKAVEHWEDMLNNGGYSSLMEAEYKFFEFNEFWYNLHKECGLSVYEFPMYCGYYGVHTYSDRKLLDELLSKENVKDEDWCIFVDERGNLHSWGFSEDELEAFKGKGNVLGRVKETSNAWNISPKESLNMDLADLMWRSCFWYTVNRQIEKDFGCFGSKDNKPVFSNYMDTAFDDTCFLDEEGYTFNNGVCKDTSMGVLSKEDLESFSTKLP